MSESSHGLFSRLADALVAVIARDRRRAALVLAVCIGLGAVAGAVARRIHVDTNLEALLPGDAPAVVALDELRSRQGSTDLLNIAVQSDDPAANERLIRDIHERIAQWPEVVESFADRDYTPIRDHSLYYLSIEDLTELRDRLKREKQRAVASKLGLGEGTFDPRAIVGEGDWDADPDAGEDDDWGDKPSDKPPGGGDDWDADAPDDDEGWDAPADPAKPHADEPPDEPTPGKTVGEILDEQRVKLAASGRISESDLDVIWPEENERGEIEWKDRVGRPIAAKDGKVWLVQARLTNPATDLKFARAVAGKVDALLEELDPTSYAPDMLAKIGGPYSTAGEANAIIRDLKRATWLSATLVALVLIGAFRSPRGLVVILVPLTTAVVITVAAAYFILGELNVLTAFLFAVLLGIGVDFAVHLYAQRERQGPEADWGAVLRHHLRPLTASMLTTFGSFMILLLADFKGFREFGLIAGVGVLISFAAALVMVPALDLVMGKLRRPTPDDGPAVAAGGHRFGVMRLVTLAAVIGVGLWGMPGVAFEKDMRNLKRPQTEADKGIGYKKALEGTQRTGTPVAILADDTTQLAAAVEVLDGAKDTDRIEGSDKLWIAEVISLAGHMPVEQQAKRPLLEEIATISEGFLAELPDLAKDDPARKYQTHLEMLERLSQAKPIVDEDLPTWAKRLFREVDGSIGRIGLMYVNVAGYDLDQVTWTTTRFRDLVEDTNVRGASTRFILADLTIAVEKDTGRLPPLALLVILALIAFDLRKVLPTVATFASLCGGLLLTFGVMGLWPIRINFYNLVVMPAVVGLGIDASIHLWHARKTAVVGATAKAASVSALTTAGGFAGLVIADHRGLQSIGLLGVVATLCCVAVALIALAWPRTRG